MAKSKKLKEYLNEHLTYEVLMLRYCHGNLNGGIHPLLWNSQFESFVIHARNLYDFFGNDADTRTYTAKDFDKKFKAKKIESVRGTFDRLHRQVFHLGRNRGATVTTKVKSKDLTRVLGWIEQQLLEFIAQLPNDLKTSWQSDRADPAKFVALVVDSDVTHSTSSQPIFPPVLDTGKKW